MTDKNVHIMTRDEEIARHLAFNPTVPVSDEWLPEMTKICSQAIDAVNAHDLDRQIPLPEGIQIRDLKTGIPRNFAWAWEVVKRWRLDHWLNKEWF